MTRDADLRRAMARLWLAPPPGPRNLYASPEFKDLSAACAAWGGGTSVFGLGTALRALGLPSQFPAGAPEHGLSLDQAVLDLTEALTRTTTTRRYLCPLDLADTLPPLRFGSAQVARFASGELDRLFDGPRMRRYYPRAVFEPRRLAMFQWLVVETTTSIDPRPEARAMPFLFESRDTDTGAIDPHRGTFPASVEDALAFLLIAPWEDWSTLPQVDWRGFRIPWVHVVDDDLFVRPTPPPNADSLTIEEWIAHDHWGEEEELERPTILPLEDAVSDLEAWSEARWSGFERARHGPLFETPVMHFLARGFASDGVDEVMAHMTAIEAALGTRYDKAPKEHKAVRTGTGRVSARIAGLLDDVDAALAYRDLFEVRSAFVHGRGGLDPVSTPQRVQARRLARRVASALADLGQMDKRSREAVLETLRVRGRDAYVAAVEAREAQDSAADGGAGKDDAF